MVEDFFAHWGQVSAGALLALVVVFILSGKLVWKKSQDKVFQDMKEHYESRIADLKEVHSDVTSGLRATNVAQGQALGVATNNVQKLVQQQDELLDLARTAAPALIAQRAEIESGSTSNTRPER